MTAWKGSFDMQALIRIIMGVITLMMMLMIGGVSSRSDIDDSSFEMEMVYKYSEKFRELTKGRAGWEHVASQEWPSPGTAEFYNTLVKQDRHRHASRNLLDVYSLYDSNSTYYIPTLGGIHYTTIALGTPPKLFIVALDTGSDLLWVPCDCQQCSVANWANYGLDIPTVEFAIYSPSNSTSSKAVACDSEICTATLSPTPCGFGATKSCTYVSKYLSPNTSSSGTIVQDVVYLNLENGVGKNITTDIYFGCGTTQTGDFLKGGAPNGLFGLGPEAYSVPSTLARNGVTQNVFSMCFSNPSDPGRLVFGRKPSASLQSTPLIPTNPSVFYVLGIEGVVAGGIRFNLSGKVVFDTGTSVTTLPSNVVKVLGDAMSSKTTLESFSLNFENSLLFDYCWNVTTTAEVKSLSPLSFIFGGGGTWTTAHPFLGFTRNNVLEAICLGIVATEANSPSIIGYNFMGNYEYFFDIGASTFSWGPSNCSGSNTSNTILTPSSTAPSFAPQSSPSSSTPSSSSPSTSRVQEPPPSTPLNDSPQAPTSQQSNAHPRSLESIPYQVLLLLVFTVFFQFLVYPIS